MTPRLVGPRVALVPVPTGLPSALGDAAAVASVLAAAGLRPAPGWPHDDTAVALSTGGEQTWLVSVDGAVIGECGWKGPPDHGGEVEIGYGLAAPSRGHGLGTEAVALLVAWTESRPGVRAVTAEVLVGNEPSRRLLRRLGFCETGTRDGVVRAARGRVRIRGRHVC